MDSKIADMITEMRTWIGTPFVHQGRVKGVGCDCAAIPVMAGRFLGGSYHSPTDYSRLPTQGRLVAIVRKQMRQIPKHQRQPGDIIIFTMTRAPQHLALVTDKGILHADQANGKVVEVSLDDQWIEKIHSVYRFKELAD